MKKDWRYITYLTSAFLVYLIVTLAKPREINWTITYHRADKNPFGAYVLSSLICDVFPSGTVNQNNYTAFELLDTLSTPTNFFALTTKSRIGEEDTKALLRNVAAGGTALIAAQTFEGTLVDTLTFSTSDVLFSRETRPLLGDSVSITFTTNLSFDTTVYRYSSKNVYHYFNSFDSTQFNVLATNQYDYPVALITQIGKGKLIVCSTPLAFTNFYLLHGNNHKFASTLLSQLPPTHDLIWTEYYHAGRMQPQTPLRFVLSTEPLAWAYYVTISGLILFIVFEAKRKQRIIPIIKPLENTTLAFVTTIANLYYNEADHKRIAEIRVHYFLEMLRSKYRINTNVIDQSTIAVIAKKLGANENELTELFALIQSIQQQASITEKELLQLSIMINKFRKQH